MTHRDVADVDKRRDGKDEEQEVLPSIAQLCEGVHAVLMRPGRGSDLDLLFRGRLSFRLAYRGRGDGRGAFDRLRFAHLFRGRSVQFVKSGGRHGKNAQCQVWVSGCG